MAIKNAVMSVADITLSAANGRVTDAERSLYDAEVALHIAHQTGVDAWIAAAAERLHAAIGEHTDALAAA